MTSDERELRSALENAEAALTKERELSDQLRADKSSMQARLNELEQKQRELAFQLEALKQPAPFKPDKSAPWLGKDAPGRAEKGPIHWSVLSVIFAIAVSLNVIVIFSTGKEFRGVTLWANLMALVALALFLGVRALR